MCAKKRLFRLYDEKIAGINGSRTVKIDWLTTMEKKIHYSFCHDIKEKDLLYKGYIKIKTNVINQYQYNLFYIDLIMIKKYNFKNINIM